MLKTISGKEYKFICIFMALLFILSGCMKQEPVKNEKNNVIPVRVEKVELKDLYESIEYIGDIKAQDEAVVYPKVSGKIIEKVKEDSNPVGKGEAIVYIDRDEVGLKFEKAPVESPLAGVIGRIYVDIGVNVSPQTPVALVVNMDKVKVNLDIPEKYLTRILLGQEARVTVDAYPEKEFIGKIAKISPVLNSQTRSAPIEITIDNAGHSLRSGMFAKVNLILGTYKKVPVILREAVMGKEPDLYVYVVKDEKAILRKVSLGIRQGPYLQVKTGLSESENVVVMGQQRLFDEAPVTIGEKENNE